MKAVEKLVPFWFTSKTEAEESEPTRFRLRGLTPPEFLEVVSEKNQVLAMRIALGYGLIGWKNFKDSSGEVKFADPLENFSRLPITAANEIVEAILKNSKLSGDEVKN